MAAEYYQGESGTAYTERLRRLDKIVELRRTHIFKPYVSNADTVLDFGCGTGSLLASLEAKSKAGVEISDSSRAIASLRGLEVGASLQDFSGRKFSRVISSHALEHVANPSEVLASMREHLEPDGLLILALPLDDWRRPADRYWRPGNKDMHLYTWTPLTIGNLLVVSGLRPLMIEVLAHAHPPRIGYHAAKISRGLDDILARISAWVLLSRQLVVVAAPGPDMKHRPVP
jgi:SAM-dependent methyltransferase